MDISEERRCDVRASDAEKLGGHLQIGCLQIEDFSLMKIQRKAMLTRWAVSLGLPMCYSGASVYIRMRVERRTLVIKTVSPKMYYLFLKLSTALIL